MRPKAMYYDGRKWQEGESDDHLTIYATYTYHQMHACMTVPFYMKESKADPPPAPSQKVFKKYDWPFLDEGEKYDQWVLSYYRLFYRIMAHKASKMLTGKLLILALIVILLYFLWPVVGPIAKAILQIFL